MLKQFLRIYCNYQQSYWSQLLPLAKFTYNNTSSFTTGIFLFFTNKGYHPWMHLQVKCVVQATGADSFVTNLKIVHKDLRIAIENAQWYYQVPVDKRCSLAPKIEIDNHVFILAKFIKFTWPTKKLSEKYLGPFIVVGKPGTHLYLIKLPNHLYTIYLVFYIS